MDLLERVERALPSERVAIACSGGADSVALVHLARDAGRDIVCFHVDHALRDDSAVDAAFVEELCRSLGVPFSQARVDVPRRASMEAAARDARYAALARLATERGIAWVATAHTLDDQAETVLLRATRGGSLAGIAARRKGFVRPLLGVRRHELRTYLSDRHIAWRDDPTNDDLSIERNWTRHVVLPQLTERRPGVARVLARLAERSAEDEAALEWMARSVYATADVDGTGIRVRDARAIPRGVLRRVARRSFRELGGGSTEADLDAILAGDRVRSRGVHAWFDGDLCFVREPVVAPPPLALGRGVHDAPQWGVRVKVSDGSGPAWRWRTTVPDGSLAIRSRLPGDRVHTAGGTKKIHDVLVDAKIPRALRDLVPVVASDRSLAVVGLTRETARATLVVDAEPLDPSWTKAMVWTRP